MDFSGNDLFLGIEVLELLCGCGLYFWAKVVWVLWVIGVPPTKIVIVYWYFGFPIGVEGPIIVLSEFYPEIVFSL